MKVSAIIPARYCSKRLPGKPLIKIHGKSMCRESDSRPRHKSKSKVHKVHKVCKVIDCNFINLMNFRLLTL